MQQFNDQQNQAKEWFQSLQSAIIAAFEKIESDYLTQKNHPIKPDFTTPQKFQQTPWNRAEGGGGIMTKLKGNVFEKVGVNFSQVDGKFSKEFAKKIPGAQESNGNFWASGISLVAHMRSPLVPAIHMNTRFICTSKSWFGGGIDLNPALPEKQETQKFHQILKQTCDTHDEKYYQDFKEYCDDYFFIKHRGLPRGVGGIFFDYLNTNNFENDFNFTKDVGKTFLKCFEPIVRNKMLKPWSEKQREQQLKYRSLYAEFNLLYDRGTKFGLNTNGNVDAILVSMPPLAKWD